jgi:hypothetical protein
VSLIYRRCLQSAAAVQVQQGGPKVEQQKLQYLPVALTKGSWKMTKATRIKKIKKTKKQTPITAEAATCKPDAKKPRPSKKLLVDDNEAATGKPASKKSKQSKTSLVDDNEAATGKPASKKSKQSKKSLVADDGDTSWFCKLCKECVKESMIKCQQCNDWMHCD